ncbi:unnamed protein product [Cochlearia groenlandica]
MAWAMKMFQMRYLGKPSPFHSSRIAFLDLDFISIWKGVSDIRAKDGIDWEAKSTIHVYDSICIHVRADSDIAEDLRMYNIMIPAMLNRYIPETERKKSERQFIVTRLKSQPQNMDPGDCGVFTLKYIECLALGVTFEV